MGCPNSIVSTLTVAIATLSVNTLEMKVFISSVIHFDESLHPVVLYVNYIICIFMNNNENLKHQGENHWIN